jgi:hypothetical protein
MRIYINETSTPQTDVRAAVESEIVEVLRSEGINLNDKSMTVPIAREYIYKKVQSERKG